MPLLCVIREQLEKLRITINSAKETKIDVARPQILAAEENLHSMIVDLDKVVTKVCVVTGHLSSLAHTHLHFVFYHLLFGIIVQFKVRF